MDVRLQGNSHLHYGVNGGAHRNSRHVEDDALRFLSQEEQECLQFFEETIDSLEESLEEDNRRTLHVKPPESSCYPASGVHGLHTSSLNPGVTLSSHQDIIDLVHPEPDLVQTKERMFNPNNPDFQLLLPNPESHLEVKPKHDSSEYNPPLPSGSYGSTDSHSSYHPPGSIPTPVLIAQKIAENQAGGTSNFHPSSMLHRLSLDSEKLPGDTTDDPVKKGPPTAAKPPRFPANINVIHSGRDNQRQNAANVNILERREQMLSNLSGSNHPLLQENPQQAVKQNTRNTPTRSISFKDPTPDKSRMEALSKLGLNRSRAMSGGISLQITPNSTSLDTPKALDTSPNSLGANFSQTTQINLPKPNVTVTPPTHIHVDRKPEILQTHSLRSYEDRSSQLSPSSPAFNQKRPSAPPVETRAPTPPQAEVSSLEFNNYGGKSIVVNPSVSSKSEPVSTPSSHEPKILPPSLSNPTEHNVYGGKSKVLSVAPVVTHRSNLPDILSSHIDKTQVMVAKPELLPPELNSYGGKSLSFSSATAVSHASGNTATSFRSPAPAPAPRPPRHSYHGQLAPPRTAARAPSPEHKRRSNSMFRPQGITVQFSGRGGMNESRREALRKLGLLKD
ncbi:proline and serine-rich protein 2 [Cololabis saira]|uniref:proline and serine-rich protein 2 n=1 Tax=Cololabis saira TaxID=129043 RepID=UPI002AD31393|nr:proline and serine-rich protein 2 [Cololabis saira]